MARIMRVRRAERQEAPVTECVHQGLIGIRAGAVYETAFFHDLFELPARRNDAQWGLLLLAGSSGMLEGYGPDMGGERLVPRESAVFVAFMVGGVCHSVMMGAR